jgi:glucosamine--fructose-6-phosphate aminotransferase (isomerizing)
VAPSGPPFDGMVELLGELRDRYGARLVVVSDEPAALRLGDVAARLTASLPHWLQPVASVVPGQLLAMHLARARGLDPDDPRHIRKVTLTS